MKPVSEYVIELGMSVFKGNPLHWIGPRFADGWGNSICAIAVVHRALNGCGRKAEKHGQRGGFINPAIDVPHAAIIGLGLESLDHVMAKPVKSHPAVAWLIIHDLLELISHSLKSISRVGFHANHEDAMEE